MDNEFTLKVLAKGPYVAAGEFKLILPSGEEKVMSGKTFLCRCGASKNKPFCDGSHTQIDFDK